MMKVSVELVPRDAAALTEELTLIKDNFDCIDIINIPDLLRYELRSWEAAKIAQGFYADVMPHIRAIDIDLSQPLPMAEFFKENKIKEVLVITGDPPQDMGRKIYPTVSTDVIRKFKDELPDIKVYAGIDQYRSSMRQEEYNIRRKVQAGADGFFTQPFFDMRYLEMYAELLAGRDVYWGVSPVMSSRSVNYWETKNNVIFPHSFAPTLEWNIGFAQQVMDFAARKQANVYLMPIRTNLIPYLTGVFCQSMI